MASSTITMDIERIEPGEGSAPGTIVGVDVDSGQTVELKAWSDRLALFTAGNTYRFGWYLGKEYQGVQDKVVSKHGDVTQVNGPNGSQRPVDDPSDAPHEKKAPAPQAPPKTTPQGVMTGSQTLKERSITVLAVMKSVIESGGSEADFDFWLAKHDQIVLGK
jgi:hypothetical protein